MAIKSQYTKIEKKSSSPQTNEQILTLPIVDQFTFPANSPNYSAFTDIPTRGSNEIHVNNTQICSSSPLLTHNCKIIVNFAQVIGNFLAFPPLTNIWQSQKNYCWLVLLHPNIPINGVPWRNPCKNFSFIYCSFFIQILINCGKSTPKSLATSY